MVEGSANEISEEILCDAVMLGFNSVSGYVLCLLSTFIFFLIVVVQSIIVTSLD